MKKALIIIAIFIGILLALQIRSFRGVTALFERAKPANVLAQLRTFQIANEQLQTHISEKTKELEDLKSKIASEAFEDEIKKLRLISGEEGVTGEGVEITMGRPVQEFWMSDLVAQLVSAGAEAIAINDIRLIPRTAGFRTINNGMVMGANFLTPPLRIIAIGPRKDLFQSVGQNGGLIDRIQNNHPGLTILISQRDKITIPPLEQP